MSVSARLTEINKRIVAFDADQAPSLIYYDNEDNYYVGDKKMTTQEWEQLRAENPSKSLTIFIHECLRRTGDENYSEWEDISNPNA